MMNNTVGRIANLRTREENHRLFGGEVCLGNFNTCDSSTHTTQNFEADMFNEFLRIAYLKKQRKNKQN